jgi:hypothetical protein
MKQNPSSEKVTDITTQPDQKTPPEEDIATKGKAAPVSTYAQADREAKRGNPLSAETPADRAPKQENL